MKFRECNQFWIITAFTTSIVFINAQDTCLTPYNLPGYCVWAEHCPPINFILNNLHRTRSDARFVKDSHCGTEFINRKYMTKMCCDIKVAEPGCILPEYPENGSYKVNGVEMDIGAKVSISTVLTYECKENYIPHPQDVTYCQNSVMWDKNITCEQNAQSPPEVTLFPSSLNIFEGDAIELNCNAIGNPSPDITWTRPNRRSINELSSITNGTLLISSARTSDQDEYRCTAINIAGNNYKSAIVNVRKRNNRPILSILTVDYINPIVNEGSSLTLVCSTDAKIPSHMIYWERVNGYLPSTFRSVNGNLQIKEIRPEDAGFYKCSADRVSEEVIPITIEIHVQQKTVQTSGHIRIDVTNITLFEGQFYSVNCEPSGNPLPTIIWTKVGSKFEPGVSQQGNRLLISQAKRVDRGIYSCIGTMDNITVEQKFILLNVERRELPEVEVWPTGMQTLTSGSDITLQCRFTKGSPNIVVYWRTPSGQDIHNTNGVLSLKEVTIEDQGVYMCIGANAVGTVSTNVTIVIYARAYNNLYK